MNFGSNLKAIRKKLSLSLRDLSQVSGVSKTMLSEIETGKKTPTITVACKIANAVGISLAALMGIHDRVDLVVVRKNERLSILDPETLIRRQMVSPSFSTSDIEITFISMPAGASTGSVLDNNPGNKEYMVLTKGAVQVRIGMDTVCDLEEGDSMYFEAAIEHEIINTGRSDAEYFLVYRKETPKNVEA